MEPVNYLVLTTNAVTLDQMKAYKSLDAHNYLTSGFIHRDILSRYKHYLITYYCLNILLEVNSTVSYNCFCTQVNHSQNLRQPALVVWVLAKKNGEVITGHCNCMAGQSSSCSHVGAILFAIAEGIKIRSSQTFTDRPNNWIVPHVKDCGYKPLRKINFMSAATASKRQCLEEKNIQNLICQVIKLGIPV
ncbi:uncharacterized protein [Centruroides vittatus]|uniref:uncharacterized protein n=1 Tax=Centruroides vittatus TaxID=120091 RepID=UPI00350F483C